MQIAERARVWLPEGRPLPEDEWAGRHKALTILLWVNGFALMGFGIIRGYGIVHSILEGSIPLVAAAIAGMRGTSRPFRSIVTTLGLMSASAILVHLSGGTIEAHFHFFVMIGLITLYQAWFPFLLSIAYVVLHHGVMGTLDPASVYNHPAALQAPFKWATIHGGFVLAASIAGLVVWKRNEDLRQREQEHVELARSLDAFSSAVAHDLKTPLGAIQGAAATMTRLADAEDEDTRQLLSIIEKQSRKAGNLITGLLALARARGAPLRQPIELRTFVADIASDFPTLDISVNGSLPVIEADRTGMRQVLINLFENTAKHAVGRNGRATVEVSTTPDSGGVILTVADRGPGVPRSDIDTVFDPLVRGRTTRQGDGAGLGLAIVSAIAEAHGGRAWYEPRPGGGSVFNLFIGEAPEEARPPSRTSTLIASTTNL